MNIADQISSMFSPHFIILFLKLECKSDFCPVNEYLYIVLH